LPPDEAAKLVGRRLDELFDPAVGVIADEALPLDRALHDLAGVILGVPVYEMLGGAKSTAVGVYSGAIYMDDITPAYAPGGVRVVVEHCRQDYDYGYRAFKLKIGRGHRWMEPEAGLARDIEVTRAVREQFPECEILVDANNGYDCGGFLRYFEAVADCRLYTIEEPFHENRDDLRRLRDAIEKHAPATTVTEGESNADVELLLRLASEGLVQLLNLDIGGYGFTAWRRLAPLERSAPTGRCWGAGIPVATRAPIRRTWSSWPGASLAGSLKEAGDVFACHVSRRGAVYFPALGLSGATSTSTRPSSAITFFTWAPFPGMHHLIVTGPAT